MTAMRMPLPSYVRITATTKDSIDIKGYATEQPDGTWTVAPPVALELLTIGTGSTLAEAARNFVEGVAKETLAQTR